MSSRPSSHYAELISERSESFRTGSDDQSVRSGTDDESLENSEVVSERSEEACCGNGDASKVPEDDLITRRTGRHVSAVPLDIMTAHIGIWPFELVSILLIVLSMLLTTTLTVPEVDAALMDRPSLVDLVRTVQLCFGVTFTAEYFVRMGMAYRFGSSLGMCLYLRSRDGVIDAIGAASLVSDLSGTSKIHRREFRWGWMFRLLRVLKLVRYFKEMNTIAAAVVAESRALLIFMVYVFLLCFLFGTVLFYLEEDEAGFTSIPAGMWCVIVTMSTVGYGDLVPQSVFGRIIICIVMLLGYSALAVPTIVGVMDVFNGQPQQRLTAGASLSPNEIAEGLVRSKTFPSESFAAPQSYPHFARMQVRPADSDRDGLIHMTALCEFFEAAIIDFYVSRTTWTPGRSGLSMPVAVKSSCELLQPMSAIAAGGEFVIGMQAVSLLESSCEFNLSAYPRMGGEVCAEGVIKHSWVASDVVDSEVVSIPGDIASALKGILRVKSAS